MSLHPNPNFVIPEETRRVAQAAFPKGTLCLSIAEVFGSLYHDDQFAALFPDHGQPATSPARLALVSVLQYVEGLSDRQAADAVRGHIDWKYALALELTDPGFDHTVLSEFRARLVEGRIEQLLLDPLTCPVNAVLAWVEAAMLTSGPLFRGVNRWNRPLPTRLSDKSGRVRQVRDDAPISPAVTCPAASPPHGATPSPFPQRAPSGPQSPPSRTDGASWRRTLLSRHGNSRQRRQRRDERKGRLKGSDQPVVRRQEFTSLPLGYLKPSSLSPR